MKTVIHLSQAEACELLAESLKARTGKWYVVEAFVSRGYDSGSQFDREDPSVRFEATEQ